MGTQPEEIEHALRGRPTLPKPGEPAQAGSGKGRGEGGREPERGQERGQERRQEPEQQPVRQPEADLGATFEGPRGQLHTPEEERRFQLRGGRHIRSSPEGAEKP